MKRWVARLLQVGLRPAASRPEVGVRESSDVQAPSRISRVALSVVGMLLVSPLPLPASDPQVPQRPERDGEQRRGLSGLSVEELMRVRVSTVLRKQASVETSPAAVYVLSGEEIHRSGAATLPEALRLIPGLSVARVDAGAWAITARGFNSTTANKLEVLLDGRSLYTPLYSGVLWDLQDTILEDVERIEVIRGPGAALWGANAVNGVINIVTRNPRETQGTYLAGTTGTVIGVQVEAREGGRVGQGWYRVYAKALDQGSSSFEDPDFDDARQSARLGFRFEGPSSSGTFELQGEAYRARSTQLVTLLETDPLRTRPSTEDEELYGGHLLAGWTRQQESGALQLRAYLEHGRWQVPGYFAERRATLDLDFQHRYELGPRHELMWGLGYRLSSDQLDSSEAADWQPAGRDLHRWSGFLQDEIDLRPAATDARRWKLTLGAKLEHDDYTGLEIQPTLRLWWGREEGSSGWAAVSRAVRTPTRVERDVRLVALVEPGDPPVLYSLVGAEVEAEELLAWELGYRMSLGPRSSIDAALFHNHYEEIVSLAAPVTGRNRGNGRIEIEVPFANLLEAEGSGGEISGRWRVNDRWRFSAWISYLDLEIVAEAGADLAGPPPIPTDPRWQGLLRSGVDLPGGWQLDAVARYTGSIPAFDLDRHLDLDLNACWSSGPGWQISVLLGNLLGEEQPELGPGGAHLERHVRLSIRWNRH